MSANDTTSARSFVNLANVVTAGSLGTGFIAVVLAGQREFAWAAGMVCVAVVLDVLDGAIARRLSQCTQFGAQLDSLADIVSFGLAPALLLYLGGLASIPLAGVGACLLFLLAGAWRLARFQLIEEPYRFIGLPIPIAGIIAAGMAAWEPAAGLMLAVTVVLAGLMVSELPLPTWRALARIVRLRRALRVKDARLAEAGVGATRSRRRG